VFSNGAVLVMPKADLLAPSPTIAGSTLLASTSLLTPSGTKAQPVVDLDSSEVFIQLAAYPLVSAQGALQPESGIGISTSSPFLATSVVRRNGVLWGVQTVGNQGRAALRWFAVDAQSN